MKKLLFAILINVGLTACGSSSLMRNVNELKGNKSSGPRSMKELDEMDAADILRINEKLFKPNSGVLSMEGRIVLSLNPKIFFQHLKISVDQANNKDSLEEILREVEMHSQLSFEQKQELQELIKLEQNYYASKAELDGLKTEEAVDSFWKNLDTDQDKNPLSSDRKNELKKLARIVCIEISSDKISSPKDFNLLNEKIDFMFKFYGDDLTEEQRILLGSKRKA